MGKGIFEDSKKKNNEGELMKNHKPRTSKQILKEKIRTDKIKKEIMEPDFYKITWDKIY